MKKQSSGFYISSCAWYKTQFQARFWKGRPGMGYMINLLSFRCSRYHILLSGKLTWSGQKGSGGLLICGKNQSAFLFPMTRRTAGEALSDHHGCAEGSTLQGYSELSDQFLYPISYKEWWISWKPQARTPEKTRISIRGLWFAYNQKFQHRMFIELG